MLHAPAEVRSKAIAPSKMSYILFTAPTSQLLRSWLNAVASSNITHVLDSAGFHLPMGRLKT